MYSFPIDYVEPVFRPPSEAKSLILPVTNGCSWNKCTFCEMYTQPQKKFRARKPDDEILRRVNKGETWESTRSALLKIREAGLTSSVMVLNGLGGESLSRQHAINTATLCNETQPDYLSTLVVSFPQGEERFREGFGDDFVQLSQQGLFEEIRLFLEHPRPSPTLARYRFVQNGCAGCNSMNREPPL